MRPKKLSIGLTAVLAIFTATLFTTTTRADAQERVLHSFGPNQGTPAAGLILDAAGNLYGTTNSGGAYDRGTAFELTPALGGGWAKKILHSFHEDGKDGYSPFAGLILDAAGNLYGTTVAGGAYNSGTVFELMRTVGGSWRERVLHSFDDDGADGTDPNASLVFDAAGNLYGTTSAGGADNSGTVFELTPQTGGNWSENISHNFSNNGTDGTGPYASLVFDVVGNLYGTTERGGVYNDGTVFELAIASGGGWIETVLHDFGSGTDGEFPNAALTFDTAGNLYGTTPSGGAYTWGMAFELTPIAGENWTETVLHNFDPNGTDGLYPYASLIFDAVGNLYSTTSIGGAYNEGIVFELTPAGGNWTETVLYSFNKTDRNAFNPQAGLIFNAAGNLYGTTHLGGIYGDGTVFEITR